MGGVALCGGNRPFQSAAAALTLPLTGTAAFVIITLSIRYAPTRLNMPFTVPDDRLEEIKPLSIWMQRLVRAEVLVGFAAIQCFTIAASSGHTLSNALPIAVLIFVAAIVVTVTIFTYRVWQISSAA